MKINVVINNENQYVHTYQRRNIKSSNHQLRSKWNSIIKGYTGLTLQIHVCRMQLACKNEG